MRIEQQILSLGITILLLGCSGENKEKNDQLIVQKTKEALGDENESGCDSDEKKSNKECSEISSSSSSFILEKLAKNSTNIEKEILIENGENIIKKEVIVEKSKNIIETNKTKEEESSLRGQLNTLLIDMSKEEEEQKKDDSVNDLESLVTKVSQIIKQDSNQIAESLENLVDYSYSKTENPKSIKEQLSSLVEEVEVSKLNREDIESKLLLLVGGAEQTKINREEIENRLLLLVGDATQSQKQTKESLEHLVTSAEAEGTELAKRLASSIIEDVAQKKIRILRAEDTFIEIQVKAGDSLSSLATKYYGSPNKYNIIVDANKEKLGNRNIIYSGTKLIIPKLEN
jgi:LysM repeat protein